MNNQNNIPYPNEGVEFPSSPSSITQQEQLRREEELFAPAIEGTPSLDIYQKYMFSADCPESEINQADIIYHNQLKSQAPRKIQLIEQIQKIDNELLAIQRKVSNLLNLKKQYQQELKKFQ